MKLWLIRIGKALTALKNEGLVRGGIRVLKSFFALFRRVVPGDILIVTGGLGDSALYRAWHMAEELNLNGLKTSVTVQDNPLLPGYAKQFQVFIFHRVLYTGGAVKLFERAKKLGKEIIFETDDLVFDQQYFQHMDYYRKMNYFERKQYAGGVGAEILADPSVRVCTTTTNFLAEKLAERGKRVFVVPNRLSRSDVAIMEPFYTERISRSGASGRIRIGYFSGAKGHDKDFATIVSVLRKLLERYPQVDLFLAGPLESGEGFRGLEGRITRMPYVPRAEHFKNVASVDINLAPLEIGNPFCEAKSELKWFEAGLLGVPTVAAATGTFREAITEGVDGFVAGTPEEWTEKLERLILDATLRQKVGEAARRTAREKYVTAQAKNKGYYEYLWSRIKH